MVAGCGNPLYADDWFGPAFVALIIVDIADFGGPASFRWLTVNELLVWSYRDLTTPGI